MMKGGRKSGVSGRSLVTRAALVLGLGMMLAAGPALAGSADSARPAQQVAADTGVTSKKPAPEFRAMTDGELQSSVCAAAATFGVGAAYWYGPSELMMFIGGGLLAPSTASVPLFLSLLAQAGGAACAIGYAIAPALM